MTKKQLIKILKTVLPLLLGVYLTWFIFHSMSDESLLFFYKSLNEANYFFVFISLLLAGFADYARAKRWQYTLEPLGYITNTWNRFYAMMIGYVVNLTIPRAGEASRAIMLQQSDGVPFVKSFGTIIMERIVDVLILGIISVITFFMVGADFWEIKNEIINKLGVNEDSNSFYLILKWTLFSIFVLVFIIVSFVRSVRKKIIEFVLSLKEGVFSIFKIQKPGKYLLYTFLIWASYILIFIIQFQALNETANVPVRGILLAFILGAGGISFTNGGIGTYPLLVGIVTGFYLKKEGIDHPEAIANALGMLIWLSQTLLMLVLGLISLYILPRKIKKNG
jgi:uncharacterized membrane protein YbhN (UPF0104 family)